jgi:hypothetical protein
VGTRCSFSRGKAAGAKLTTHLHLVLRSKNAWSYISTPPILLPLMSIQNIVYLTIWQLVMPLLVTLGFDAITLSTDNYIETGKLKLTFSSNLTNFFAKKSVFYAGLVG